MSGEIPDGIIDGASIGGLSAIDRFFVQDVHADIGIHLDTPGGIAAAAKFGFVEVGLSGGGSADAVLSLDLQDPGTVLNDGRISLAELFDGLSDINTLVSTPSLTGGGLLTLDIEVEPDIPGINIPTDAQISVLINDFGNPFTGVAPDIDFSFPDIGDLIAFDNVDFDFDSILDGLLALSDFLGELEGFEFLNAPIPLINLSVNDLVDYADRFRDAINDARNNPAGTLQVLEETLEQALGLGDDPDDLVALSLDTTGGAEILKIGLGWDAGFKESVALNLDLGLPEFANLAGAAELQAQGELDIRLDFGVDLSDPLNLYVYDSTGVSGGLEVIGEALEFRAALGPLGVFVAGGEAKLSAAVDVGLDDAIFTHHRSGIDGYQFWGGLRSQSYRVGGRNYRRDSGQLSGIFPH